MTLKFGQYSKENVMKSYDYLSETMKYDHENYLGTVWLFSKHNYLLHFSSQKVPSCGHGIEDQEARNNIEVFLWNGGHRIIH